MKTPQRLACDLIFLVGTKISSLLHSHSLQEVACKLTDLLLCIIHESVRLRGRREPRGAMGQKNEQHSLAGTVVVGLS
jgi:hypothetical protein